MQGLRLGQRAYVRPGGHGVVARLGLLQVHRGLFEFGFGHGQVDVRVIVLELVQGDLLQVQVEPGAGQFIGPLGFGAFQIDLGCSQGQFGLGQLATQGRDVQFGQFVAGLHRVAPLDVDSEHAAIGAKVELGLLDRRDASGESQAVEYLATGDGVGRLFGYNSGGQGGRCGIRDSSGAGIAGGQEWNQKKEPEQYPSHRWSSPKRGLDSPDIIPQAGTEVKGNAGPQATSKTTCRTTMPTTNGARSGLLARNALVAC